MPINVMTELSSRLLVYRKIHVHQTFPFMGETATPLSTVRSMLSNLIAHRQRSMVTTTTSPLHSINLDWSRPTSIEVSVYCPNNDPSDAMHSSSLYSATDPHPPSSQPKLDFSTMYEGSDSSKRIHSSEESVGNSEDEENSKSINSHPSLSIPVTKGCPF